MFVQVDGGGSLQGVPIEAGGDERVQMLIERQIQNVSSDFGVVFGDQFRGGDSGIYVIHDGCPVISEWPSFIHGRHPEENAADCPNVGFMRTLALFEEFRRSIGIRPSLFAREDDLVFDSKSEIVNEPAHI